MAVANPNDEASYLVPILNSAVALAKNTDVRPHGDGGLRDFDNLTWTLPTPKYDTAEATYRDLAAAAARAEGVAAAVDLAPHKHFTAKRRAIRAALEGDRVAAEIKALVDALLPP